MTIFDMLIQDLEAHLTIIRASSKCSQGEIAVLRYAINQAKKYRDQENIKAGKNLGQMENRADSVRDRYHYN